MLKESKYKNSVATAIKSTGPVLCKTGRVNMYRLAFLRGEGASRSEITYDPKLGKRGGHKCCGSKVEWRHKAKCKNAVRNAPDDYSDLKNID